MPKNAGMINVSMCANPSLEPLVTLHRVGLGAADQQCLFVAGARNVADAIARCDLQSAAQFKQAGYTVLGSFEVTTLSKVLEHDYYMMKIDVEGMEPSILSAQGSDGYFSKHRIDFLSHGIVANGAHARPLPSTPQAAWVLAPSDWEAAVDRRGL